MRSFAAGITAVWLLTGAPVLAQETSGNGAALEGGTSAGGMRDLLRQGFEIKAAVPKGASTVVFLQKDQSAYACEFVTVAKTRCGAIN